MKTRAAFAEAQCEYVCVCGGGGMGPQGLAVPISSSWSLYPLGKIELLETAGKLWSILRPPNWRNLGCQV